MYMAGGTLSLLSEAASSQHKKTAMVIFHVATEQYKYKYGTYKIVQSGM
jgi:hypothetical protein